MAWCYDCGVTMKIKPSQDNIYEGDFLDCMGLVYAIMQKFLKFDDDDGESTGTAQEALLRWTQFNTKGKVNVTNLNKSWHDGLALCALVSKFNEKAIDFDSLSGSNSERNIQMAMDAAEKCVAFDCVDNCMCRFVEVAGSACRLHSVEKCVCYCTIFYLELF